VTPFRLLCKDIIAEILGEAHAENLEQERFVVHNAVSRKSDKFVVGLDSTQFLSPMHIASPHQSEAIGLSY